MGIFSRGPNPYGDRVPPELERGRGRASSGGRGGGGGGFRAAAAC